MAMFYLYGQIIELKPDENKDDLLLVHSLLEKFEFVDVNSPLQEYFTKQTIHKLNKVNSDEVDEVGFETLDTDEAILNFV